MKPYLLMLAAAAALILGGCGKSDEGKKKDDGPIDVELKVDGIADNQATISAAITSGKATSGKIVKGVLFSQIDFDYEQEIPLISYVESAGEAITFPYTGTIEKTIAGQDYLTAVIVYDKTGRAAISKYEIWTAEGMVDGWSQSNDAGSLNPNQW